MTKKWITMFKSRWTLKKVCMDLVADKIFLLHLKPWHLKSDKCTWQTMTHHGLQESKCLSSKGDQSFPQRTSPAKSCVPPECLASFAPVSLLTSATVLQNSPYPNACETNKQIQIALWPPGLRRCIKFCRITWGIELRKWLYTVHLIAIKSLWFSVLLKQIFLSKWTAKDSFKSCQEYYRLIETTLAAVILEPVWI